MDCLWDKCVNFDQENKRHSDICDECHRFNLGAVDDLAKRLLPTNADRIRSMSDEELAEVSVYFTTRPDFDEGVDGEWYECGDIETWHSVFTADLYGSPDDAISYVLEWLRAPAETEGTE